MAQVPRHSFVAAVLAVCAAGGLFRLLQRQDPAPVALEFQEIVRVHGGQAVLVLIESGGTRRLPIPLSRAEAAMIERSRHQPRGLAPAALEALGGRVLRASIDAVASDRAFTGHLDVGSGSRELSIPATAGEALAVALQAGAPIVIDRDLLEQAGVSPDDLHGRSARGVRSEPSAAPVQPI